MNRLYDSDSRTPIAHPAHHAIDDQVRRAVESLDESMVRYTRGKGGGKLHTATFDNTRKRVPFQLENSSGGGTEEGFVGAIADRVERIAEEAAPKGIESPRILLPSAQSHQRPQPGRPRECRHDRFPAIDSSPGYESSVHGGRRRQDRRERGGRDARRRRIRTRKYEARRRRTAILIPPAVASTNRPGHTTR